MKRILLLAAVTAFSMVSFLGNAQTDKSKRPSQPDKVSATLDNGLTISVDYSQPLLKGREMGKTIDPMPGKVWRAGANEATIFEITKDATVEGKTLPAGKYSLYMLSGDDEWTIIFNKKWNQWGTVYNEAEDMLRVKVKPVKTSTSMEKLTYTVSNLGEVKLMWGTTAVSFWVK